MSIDVPTVVPPAGYSTQTLYLRMTLAQAESLKSIKYGLMAKGESLKNGQLVTKEIHAIAWILEQF